MKIWQIKAEDNHGNPVCRNFDDSKILLECTCDTQCEMVDYMLTVGMMWCLKNGYHFVSLTILAE